MYIRHNYGYYGYFREDGHAERDAFLGMVRSVIRPLYELWMILLILKLCNVIRLSMGWVIAVFAAHILLDYILDLVNIIVDRTDQKKLEEERKLRLADRQPPYWQEPYIPNADYEANCLTEDQMRDILKKEEMRNVPKNREKTGSGCKSGDPGEANSYSGYGEINRMGGADDPDCDIRPDPDWWDPKAPGTDDNHYQ
jgi:hypothetical protein